MAGTSIPGSADTNFLNVYKVSSGGSNATLMYGPLAVPSGNFGSPGGNGAGAGRPVMTSYVPKDTFKR